MIIGAGEFQQCAIIKAKEMGLEVLAVDRDRAAPGFRHADHSEIIDVRDEKGNIRAARRYRIDGVMTAACEAGVRSAAAVAHALGLPGLSPETAFRATDKIAMRKAFKKRSLPSPEFIKVRTKKEALRAVRSLQLPVIMKPADNAGSRGVSRIAHIGDLDVSFPWARENSLSGDIIVENFLKGTEMTVEALSCRGEHEILALSDKKHISFPYCVATDIIYPPAADEKTLGRVRRLAKQALDALGISSGASHSEMILTARGPYLVEAAARGGGFGIFSDIVPFVSGLDIVRQCIHFAMGRPMDIKAACGKAAVLRFFHSEAGLIRRVTGLKEAEKIHGVHRVRLFKKAGDHFSRIRCDGERPGFVIALAKKRNEAIRIAGLAEKTIRFDVAAGEKRHDH